MQFLSVLRIEASRTGNRKAHKKYITEFDRYKKLFELEQEATIAIERLQLEFAKSASEKPEHAQLAEDVAMRLGSFSDTEETFNINFIRLRLLAMASQIRIDYSQTLRICNDAFALLAKHSLFATNSRRAEFAIMRLISAVQCRRKDVAGVAIEQCQKYLPNEIANWFVFKQWQVLYLMQDLRFEEAVAITHSIHQHRNFYTLSEPAKEKWHVIQQYAKFASSAPVDIDSPAEISSIAPLFSLDKTGLNTSMVLLHILLLCELRRFSDLRDRAEFIKGYRKRFLKGPTNSQSSLLFQMLGMIETTDLNYKKLVKKSAPMLEELRRIESEEPIQGIQILPYSWIWDRVLTRLMEYHHLSHDNLT